MGKYGVTSKLVWDGGDKILIPDEMGKPRADQLQGTVREQLSELAGRVCFSPDTEILTRDGWVSFPRLQRGVEVATYNATLDQMEFQLPTDYIRRAYTGEMYDLETRSVSLLVTPDHDLFVKLSKNCTSKAPFVFAKARDVFGRMFFLKNSAFYPGGDIEPIIMKGHRYQQGHLKTPGSGVPIVVQRTVADVLIDLHQMEAWAALLGYYVSEGTLNFQKGSGPTVTIYQQEWNTAPIIEAASNCGLNPRVASVDPRNGVAHIRVGGSTLARYLVQFGVKSRNKRLPAYVFEWPAKLRETLLDALMFGDGTLGPQGTRIYNTNSEGLAADVQRLIVSLGRPCTINYSQCETCLMYRVRETLNKTFSANKFYQQDRMVPFSGEVFCVSVPNRALFTRRKNKVVIAGNCYDSVGTGRTSPDYHKHIQEVGHLSVYEHAHMTVHVRLPLDAMVFLNRPGLWVENRFEEGFRVTFNPRNILDWDMWSGQIGVEDFIKQESSFKIGDVLSFHAEQTYPMMVAPRSRDAERVAGYKQLTQVVEPETDEEKWVSMFMVGSRGFSHELVRHGDRTGISQRSTRFVAENESPWVDHPLIQEFLASKDLLPDDPENRIRGALGAIIGDVKISAREVYERAVEHLQKWLTAKGVDKLTARKQARGAARGYLGNALLTELIFSASVGQWKRMLRMRACAPADAEIRAVFVQALEALKQSRYAADFAAFSVVQAPDGLGEIVVEERS